MFYAEYLYAIPQWVLFIVVFALIFLCAEIGCRVGLGVASRRDAAAGGSVVSSLSGTLIGLLALLLGFSFAVALSRFDTRKQMLRDEVNLIGSAATTLDLLPARSREVVLGVLRDYAQERKDFYWDALKEDEVAAHLQKTYALQRALWLSVVRETNASGLEPPLKAYVVSSFEKAISQQTNRLVARNNHVPEPILWLLFALACICSTNVGYASGVNGARVSMVRLVLCLCFAIVMTAILDLDRPRRGFIRVDQQPMADLVIQLDSMRAAPVE